MQNRNGKNAAPINAVYVIARIPPCAGVPCTSVALRNATVHITSTTCARCVQTTVDGPVDLSPPIQHLIISACYFRPSVQLLSQKVTPRLPPFRSFTPGPLQLSECGFSPVRTILSAQICQARMAAFPAIWWKATKKATTTTTTSWRLPTFVATLEFHSRYGFAKAARKRVRRRATQKRNGRARVQHNRDA